MIVKSMSRKHPSFAQLIDYIEGQAKLKSRHHSVYHNLYSREREQLKHEFGENAKYLTYRKNGVYLYHEIISITRSQRLSEQEQKERLQAIVKEYLSRRASHNLAYAVLHEDTKHLHFHIVLSANEAGKSQRKRLSKFEFADIQTSLERWVLREHSELEQQAVFHKNQTTAERVERQAKKQHLSNNGEEMKRRGAKTDRRDSVQEKLTDIFERATDPKHFADLMKRAGFTLYTRGQSHGVTDREGNKYRLNRLGLAGAWQALDARMRESYQATQDAMNRADENTRPREKQKTDPETPHHAKTHTESQATRENETERERLHRLREMASIRAARAAKQAEQSRTARDRGQDRE